MMFGVAVARSVEAGVGGERTEMSIVVPRRRGTRGVNSSAIRGEAGGGGVVADTD